MNKSYLITPEKPVLALRVCKSDMSAYGGFIWPMEGHVSCPDWEDTKECGNGLHGWLWGEGDHSVVNIHSDSKWLVVQVSAYVELKGKIKFPEATVLFCGESFEATKYLAENGGHGRSIIAGTATAGDEGTATAGYRGTATAGGRGTATAGYRGTATAGYRGTLIIKRWNGNRWKFSVAYVGEDGIEPNKPYKLDSDGKFIKA